MALVTMKYIIRVQVYFSTLWIFSYLDMSFGLPAPVPTPIPAIGTPYSSEISNQIQRTPKCYQKTIYRNHSFVKLKKQGLTLHYVEAGDYSKQLLFLHGFPEFWISWRHQLKYFAKDYWVVAIDMPGFGDSDKPKTVSDYTYEIIQAVIIEFVHTLGRKQCILVGHDWGGIMGYVVAARNSNLVTKLITMNAPHPNIIRSLREVSTLQAFLSW